MYFLSRSILTLAVMVYGYCGVLLAVLAFEANPYFGWGLLALAVVIFRRMRRRGIALTAHGTAFWSGEDQLRQARMLDANRGLFLGRLAGTAKVSFMTGLRALFNNKLSAKVACERFFAALKRRNPAPLVRMPQAINTVCIAPVGTGKSTGMVIPFLLTCEESCVVVDFKGELALATAQARRRMGHDIQILDPYKVVTQSKKLRLPTATFNPLDLIEADAAYAIDHCNDIAAALIVRTGEEKETHFLDGAETHISVIAAVTVQYGKPNARSLQSVADILADPSKLEMAIKLGQASPAWGGLLARNAAQLQHFVEKEKASVLTTCGRFLRFLSTPAMAESTKSSSFSPAKLKRGKMTAYVVLPPEHMKAQAGWLRLIIGSLIRAVVQQGLGEQRKVHFILDEAASLGVMDAIEDLVDTYRVYCCRAQFYYQSAGQLAKCWPKDQGQIILSNTSKIFFSVQDIQTATLISSMLGKETIIVESGGSGRSGGRNSGSSSGSSGFSSNSGENHGWSSNEGWQQAPRELLKPEEILTLPPRYAITLPGGGMPPVLTYMLRYFEEPWLGKRTGGLISRFTAAGRTLLGSLIVLAIGIFLAAILTQALAAQVNLPQDQPANIPGNYGW
jgi:type IV secretion system protein VirD4